MKYWVIEQKSTGAYFPLSSRGSKRGSTHINLPFVGTPRLFTKPHAAKSTLEWWLCGQAVTEYDNDGDGRYAVGASPGEGDPRRNPDDFHIVPVSILRLT